MRAFDADVGEVLAFSLAQAPTGMTINAANGLVRWTPAGGQTGGHVVAIKVTDSQGEFAYPGYTVDSRRRRVRAECGGPDAGGGAGVAGRCRAYGRHSYHNSGYYRAGGTGDQPGDRGGNERSRGRGSEYWSSPGTQTSRGSQRRGPEPSRGPECN